MTEPDRYAAIEAEYASVLDQLSEPDVAKDRKVFLEASRRHKQLERIVVAAIRELRASEEDLQAAREMLEGGLRARKRELGRLGRGHRRREAPRRG